MTMKRRQFLGKTILALMAVGTGLKGAVSRRFKQRTFPGKPLNDEEIIHLGRVEYWEMSELDYKNIKSKLSAEDYVRLTKGETIRDEQAKFLSEPIRKTVQLWKRRELTK